MATTKPELKQEVRVFTDHSHERLSSDELDTVVERADKHVRSRKDIEDTYDLLGDSNGEEALFWFACLFSKLKTGELDAQTLQVGAIDVDTLLAEEGDEVVTWLRNARLALRSLDTDDDDVLRYGTGITAPTRGSEVGSDEDTSETFGTDL
jgi:hypothetical protein